MSNNFAVFGHPVAHSLSPRIHAAFAKQAGLSLKYTAVDVEPWQLSMALEAFAADGGRGANLTVPHKQAGLALCSALSERARGAGAVNTLVRRDDGWFGDNTDGAAMRRSSSAASPARARRSPSCAKTSATCSSSVARLRHVRRARSSDSLTRRGTSVSSAIENPGSRPASSGNSRSSDRQNASIVLIVTSAVRSRS